MHSLNSVTSYAWTSDQFIRDAINQKKRNLFLHCTYTISQVPTRNLAFSYSLWIATKRKELFIVTRLERSRERQQWIVCWLLKWAMYMEKDWNTGSKIHWCWSLNIFIHFWGLEDNFLFFKFKCSWCTIS